MYKTMYELLTTHAPLTALVPVDSIGAGGSFEDRKPVPRLVVIWLPQLAKGSGRYVSIAEIRVHDDQGSYDLIRQINRVIRALLEGVQQYQGSDGWITECSYAGDSGESFDPDLRTNFQSTNWEIVGRSTS